jgi:hypothetical protein
MSNALWILASGIIGVFGFLLGKIFSESEKILADKRRVYETYLTQIPNPSSAFGIENDTQLIDSWRKANFYLPVLLLYASPSVSLAVTRYQRAHAVAAEKLTLASDPLSGHFKDAARAQNDLILEMRRDAFAWSVFGYRGPPRQ